MGFWDKVKSAFGGGTPLEVDVRNAMLARCARREAFTALDIANDVTGNNPNRTVDDIKAVTLAVDTLHGQKLLEPFGYSRDSTFRFVPPALGAPPPAQQQSQQPAPPRPPAPGTVNVVSQVGVSPPRTGDSPEVTGVLDEAVRLKRCTLLDGPNRWEVQLETRSYAITIHRPGQTPQRTTSSFASEPAARDGYQRAIRDAMARGLRAAPPGSAPAPVAPVRPGQPAPPVRAPPPPAPVRVDPFAVKPELLGLSKDELRKRAMNINPYQTAWIGRVDTIPPQSDERTALIDRGLMLRGFLDAEQLRHIHEVGDLWIRYHDAAALANALAAKTADEAVERQRAERAAKKAQKMAESAERKKQRAEDIARRRAEDIVFLGRGVSSGLADRRSNVERLQQLGLPVLSTPADLAAAMGLDVPRLRWLCFHAEAAEKTHYKYFEVKKRSGGTRLLAAPMPAMKKAQRWVLANILDQLPTGEAAHGFVKGRSTVTNARAHVGRNLVVSFDLKDFFPSIRFKRVRLMFKELGYSPAVATVLALLCTEAPRRKVEYDGKTYWVAAGERALPQGAPTSPALSNRAALRVRQAAHRAHPEARVDVHPLRRRPHLLGREPQARVGRLAARRRAPHRRRRGLPAQPEEGPGDGRRAPPAGHRAGGERQALGAARAGAQGAGDSSPGEEDGPRGAEPSEAPRLRALAARHHRVHPDGRPPEGEEAARAARRRRRLTVPLPSRASAWVPSQLDGASARRVLPCRRMLPGQESKTAVMVCLARAAAHGTPDVGRFEDPTAAALLPDDARAQLEQFRAGPGKRGFRRDWRRVMLERRSKMMVVRTVAIDDAVRAAAAPQLVILGAGLDGRAWRMGELKDSVVFEVDHPDSQRSKRQRAAGLKQAAKEVRFVPVDFARDDLDAALTAAGHDPSRPTTWVWEGVVMYLERAAIESTLAVVARRSPPKSHLVINYHSPAFILHLVGFVTRRVGEPIRSAFTADQMRALLAARGFAVVRDDDLPALGAAYPPSVAEPAKVMRHTRIVVAERL